METRTENSSSLMNKIGFCALAIAIVMFLIEPKSLFTYNETSETTIETANSLTTMEPGQKRYSEMTEEELWSEYEKLKECAEEDVQCWLTIGLILEELLDRGVDISIKVPKYFIAQYFHDNTEHDDPEIGGIILVLPVTDKYYYLLEEIYSETSVDIYEKYDLDSWIRVANSEITHSKGEFAEELKEYIN